MRDQEFTETLKRFMLGLQLTGSWFLSAVYYADCRMSLQSVAPCLLRDDEGMMHSLSMRDSSEKPDTPDTRSPYNRISCLAVLCGTIASAHKFTAVSSPVKAYGENPWHASCDLLRTSGAPGSLCIGG